jgi:hypothetical protein
MAREFRNLYPGIKIQFASFFSQSCHYAEEEGFDSIYLPDALNAAATGRMPDSRLKEFDEFCRSEGMGLNSILQTERFLPRDPGEAEGFLHRHLLVLDSIIDACTLSISSLYDHCVYLAAGMMTHWKGGAHFAFVGCGVPGGRVIGVRLPWQTWRNPQLDENAAKSLEHCRMEVLLPSEQRVTYMKKPAVEVKLSIFDRWKLAAMRKRFAKRDYEAGSYFPTHQRNRYMHALRWRWRQFSQRVPSAVWDVACEADLNKINGATVFMALHMEPEATILMYCPRLRDQIESARLVSEALPIGCTLLVKENPLMKGKRPKGYYTALKRFPNIRLVDTSVPTSCLIERSAAVISLAGTVTVEARVRGKKAYCFGRPPFHRLASETGIDAVLNELSKLDVGEKPNKDTGSNTPLAVEEWAEWISATFVAESGLCEFNRRIGKLSFDSSAKNAKRYISFIQSCL